ncbi:hypothetical protein LINGRAHAP2_LOCUS6760 [Linum grandiflorum]
MAPFELRSINLFISSSDNATVDIYELTADDDVAATDWTLVASAGPLAKTQPHYDALKVFDKMIKGRPLRNLAEDLTQSHVLVNLEGLCFLDVRNFIHPILGFQFLRLQDLFLWSHYGVCNSTSITTVWNPRDILYGGVVVDHAGRIAEKDAELENLTHQVLEMEAQLDQAKSELSFFRKHYWGAVLPSSKGKPALDAEGRRRKLPPTTFARVAGKGAGDRFRGMSLDVKAVDNFDVIDGEEEVGPAPEFKVGWDASKGGKFDSENWWYVRSSHPDGGSTMVAYYEGSFDYVEFYNGHTGKKERVPVPCAVDANFKATRHLRLASLSSLHFRVVFTYIPSIPLTHN